MKKIWLVLVLVGAWFLYAHRMTLFLRDPLGTVTRGGAYEEGAQVYLNYDNDVVVMNDKLPKYIDIVQHGQPVGVSASLKCLFSVMCLVSAYPAPQIAPVTGMAAEIMTNRQVQFKDENGREVVVRLR